MFPGIIAAIICDKIIVHQPKWDYFKFGTYSFVLGVTCYIFLQFIQYFFDLLFSYYFSFKTIQWSNLAIWHVISNGNITTKPSEVFQATVLSLPVAYFSSFVVNYKILNKISQLLRVSDKYGDENLYSFYLNAKEIDWIYIRDIENNLTYEGKVFSYSENDTIQEIVLSDVTVYSYRDSEEYYSIPSLYLCKKMGSLIIESIPKNSQEIENEPKTTETIT